MHNKILSQPVNFQGSVDFEKQLAHLSFGCCAAKSCFDIKFIAIIQNMVELSPMFSKISKIKRIETDCDGKTWINIPRNTVAIEFKLCLKCCNECDKCKNKSKDKKNNKNCNKKSCKCIKLSLCFPEEMENELQQKNLSSRLAMRNCNTCIIDCTAFDHGHIKEQAGPCRSARALAIAHIAMFECYIAVHGGYQTYLNPPVPPQPKASSEAAMAQAMYETLIVLYPDQITRLTNQLNFELNKIPDSKSKTLGIALGKTCAKAILDMRANDGANSPPVYPETTYDQYITENPITGPGQWTQDPISKNPIALGYHWDQVKPFIIPSASIFRASPSPALNSVEYMMAFDEVKALGGDGITTPTVRTADQTEIGIFFGYDGANNIGVPPRLYNQITTQIAVSEGLTNTQLIYLLALVNVGMADAGLTAWETKYYYKIWRPITAIREADSDGNPGTIADPNWTPLGAPASNSNNVNFTPNFPSYTSGHATFMYTVAKIIQSILGKNQISINLTSDEYNGITKDNQGNVRPYRTRYYNSISQIAEDNGQSRIYLGIHYAFDKTAGQESGTKVANYVFDNLYQPI